MIYLTKRRSRQGWESDEPKPEEKEQKAPKGAKESERAKCHEWGNEDEEWWEPWEDSARKETWSGDWEDWKGQGRPGAWTASQSSQAVAPKPKARPKFHSDMSHSGVVNAQDPWTGHLLIDCPAIQQLYQHPAIILPKHNTSNVRLGSIVVFRVQPEGGLPVACDIAVNGFDIEVGQRPDKVRDDHCDGAGFLPAERIREMGINLPVPNGPGKAYQQLVKGPSYRPPKLQDRVFFVTGANSGIGFEASKAFALAGATVVFGCRDQKRATTAMRALVTEGVSEAQLHFLPLDLTSLQSVRRCAQLLEESGLKVDVLVLNAGVMRRCRELTEDGFEMTMAANHLGHFLLVQLLVPHLLAQEAQGRHPRVVMVGSNLCYSHDVFDFEELVAVRSRREAESFKAKPYSLFSAYAQSKLANLLMTSELARRLPRIPVNCVHPGEVLTQVMNDMHPVVLAIYASFRPVARKLFKSPEEGAVCTVFVATSPELSCTGQYFMRLRPAKVSKVAQDPDVARRLWELSVQLTQSPDEINKSAKN
ncbi:unnamed protein product [Durusdinium trenchii]|uniref:Protochlorophyllide reductase n=1 Tax=Durusdinium trenchii TaxID=1381693 RepID=A0ABP0JAB1_9DINO